MIATYILILCVSAGFAAWTGLRIWQRIAPLVNGGTTHIGLCASVPAIAFLVVVGAPPSVLCCALAAIVVALRAPSLLQRPWLRRSLAVLAIGIPLLFLRAPDPSLWQLPSSAIPWVIAALYALPFGFSGLLLASISRLASDVRGSACAIIAACTPLATASLIDPRANSVVIDAAILASAWGAVLWLARPHHGAGSAAILSTVLLLGYLQTAAFWHGAWIASLLSILAWIGALVATAMQRTRREHHRLEELTPRA